MKDCSETIGIRNRDLPTCGTVTQPIASRRASTWIVLVLIYCIVWTTQTQ